MRSNFVHVVLVAAAVALVAVVGFQFLGRSNPGGSGATETPLQSATSSASAEPSAPAGISVPVGSSFSLWDGGYGGAADGVGIRIVVTIPAPGWFGSAGEGVLKKNNSAGAPDGAEVTVFAETNDWMVGLGYVYVYGDPCHWASTQPDTPVTTVDEAIAALSGQPSRDAPTPADVTYDGYAGKRITLHVPDDTVFSACDEGQFRTLVEREISGPFAIHEDPGQFDLFTVLDVKGELVIFDLSYYEGAEGTPESVLDEMSAIMESVVFPRTVGP